MNDDLKVIPILKAISCPNRYLIVRFLSSGSRCAGSIAKHLAISPGAVSQHLHQLLKSDIVSANKSGTFVHYSLNHETLKFLGNELISFSDIQTDRTYCKGEEEKDCV